MRALPPDPLRRLLRWAEATGIRFEAVARRRGFTPLGLPDLRGWVPHLRTVRAYAGEAAAFPRRDRVARGAVTLDDLDLGEVWLLHDLIHVIWFDVAAVTFGAERFADRDFLVEHLLVSEAFAVLLLDYHLLSRTRHRGLAVEVDAVAFDALRRDVPRLPALDSWEMCSELVAHYLGGASPLFAKPIDLRGVPAARRAEVAAAIARWRDHEASYSDKQRWYVVQWRDDLENQSHAPQRAVVHDPTIAELVWLAIRRFTSDPEPAFEAQLEAAARRLGRGMNLFAALPKYAAPPVEPDFRFTDLVALAPERARELVTVAREPSASRLFLLWQAIGLRDPARLKPREKAAVVALAKSVQTPRPDRDAWDDVRRLATRTLARARWKPQASAFSAFFLP